MAAKMSNDDREDEINHNQKREDKPASTITVKEADRVLSEEKDRLRLQESVSRGQIILIFAVLGMLFLGSLVFFQGGAIVDVFLVGLIGFVFGSFVGLSLYYLLSN